ncbi:MAG: FecR domain-containing protein [Gammaproteobacteria bacterium]
MSDRTSHDASSSLEIRAEAAAWLARLRGPNRAPDVEDGFRRWLASSTHHTQAFELLTSRLEVVERLRTRTLPEHWRASDKTASRGWRNVAVAMAAVLAFAAMGMFFHTRDAGVGTDVGEQRMLTLVDGTRIYLNTDTRVVVRYEKRARRVELKSGEALFEVAHRPDEPFVVIAGDQAITALGTTFVVRREPRKLSVTLMEGKVSVSSLVTMPHAVEQSSRDTPRQGPPTLDAAARTLSPGQRLTLTAEEPRLDRPQLDKVLAWKQGQVALDDMPLANAVIEMNRYSKVKLIVESPEAAGVRVGGFFRMGDSASFARAVASTYGLRVIERADEIVIVGVPPEGSSTKSR